MSVIVQKKYFPLTFLRAYMAAGLRVIVLNNNTEMNIKEIALMTNRNELHLINQDSGCEQYQACRT